MLVFERDDYEFREDTNKVGSRGGFRSGNEY